MLSEKELADKIIKSKDKYFCFGSRPGSIQKNSQLSRIFYQQAGSCTVNLQEHGDDIGYYVEKNKNRRFGLKLLKELNSPRAVRKHLEVYRSVGKHLLSVGARARKVNASRRDLLKLFTDYESAIRAFGYFFITPFSIDDYFFPRLARDLKKFFPAEELKDVLGVISSPTIVFEYQKYQSALLKAVRAEDFQKIVAEYAWIKEYSFQEKLLDISAARSDRRQLVSGRLEKEIKSTAANCRKNKETLLSLLSRVKDKSVRNKISLVNQYINIKTERIEIYKKFQTDFRNFFRQLAVLISHEKPGFTYDDAISLSIEEILAYLKNGSLPDLSLIRKRFAKQYVCFGYRGLLYFIYNPSLIEKIRKSFLSFESSKELKGVVVSGGRATGRVKLIQSAGDLNNFTTGEIMVANFTTPDYVPAMKKAVAIITDDGGITSHAAIIARELKKPCVVGTKIATKALHDGDLVDVDADKGTVKIIKKTGE